MIDRSYLPFQSAREYQDTGMQKWMGFFLSEHTTALHDDMGGMTFLSNISMEQRLLLLSQLYANQLWARFDVVVRKKKETYIGTISHLDKGDVMVRTREGHVRLPQEDILGIELEERDESA